MTTSSRVIRFFLATIVMTAGLISTVQPTYAQCTSIGQCYNGNECIQLPSGELAPGGAPCGSNATDQDAAGYVGSIGAPQGVENINDASQVGTNGIAIIYFLSMLIRIATGIAGIWVVFNFLVAGVLYVTNTDSSQTNTKVSNALTNSVIGILLIISAYTLTGLASLIIFGDAGFILNPTISGPSPTLP